MRPRRRRAEVGTSLVEMLLVIALLGVTAVAFAPFQSFLMRQLRDADIATRPAALSWAARHLAADARAALATRLDSGSSVRFELPGGREVVWAATAGGVLERVERVGEHRASRSFAGKSLGIARPSANLLSAEWIGPDGRGHRLEIWLRHEGRP